MTTLENYVVNPALYREVGIEAQAGDQVELFLDQVTVPALPASIFGVISIPPTRVCGGTSYSIEYDEDDLDGSGVTQLESDLINSVEVTSEAQILVAAEEAARIAADNANLPLARSRLVGLPTADVRYRFSADSGAFVDAEWEQMLCYSRPYNTVPVIQNPILFDTPVAQYSKVLAAFHTSGGISGACWEIYTEVDTIITSRWKTVLDDVTALAYAVEGSGPEAAAAPVVKFTVEPAVLIPGTFVGQHCIVEREVLVWNGTSWLHIPTL